MAISKVVYKSSPSATPVVWMDTTQKTVTSASMLNGTTALKNDGTDITGNIQSQAAQTIHPSTSDQTIASGKYLSGTQTVKGVVVSNTLTAENIKKDVVVKIGDSTDDDCVTSVTGTYEGSGGGGLEYEEGTYTPVTDTASITINFTNTHSTPPIFAMISDTNISAPNTSYVICCLDYWGGWAGEIGTVLGYNRRGYYNSSGTFTAGQAAITNTNVGSFITSSAYYPQGTSTGTYWRQGRTYKWIAVWR